MVVKGNAYGHGYEHVVPIAEEEGIRHFAVYSCREAAGFLRATDGKSRLQLLGHSDHENIEWIIENDLEPWLNDVHDWPLLRDTAAQLEKPVHVHLELETGMNRTGLPMQEALAIAREIQAHPYVILEGICTHLAGAEEPENWARIQRQRDTFDRFQTQLDEEGIEYNLRHIASSSAALLFPDDRKDLCRIGIATYGLWPTQAVYEIMQRDHTELVLRNVLTWKSTVIALKWVEDGDYVGYGRSYEAEGKQLIAVVAVGYADGFTRDLSNRGYVLIRGKRSGIVGNVNMNMMQCRVTHVEDIEVGDEVTLIGRDGEREISVSSFADFNSLVNYELMARLSWELPRYRVRDSKLPSPLE